MSLTMIVAALLAPGPAMPPAVSPPQPVYQVDRSLGDSDRLNELKIDVNSALQKGRIDRAAALRFHYDIERIRRQMIRMGIQVGYRQRVRLRARIDALQARWEAHKSLGAEGRSGN